MFTQSLNAFHCVQTKSKLNFTPTKHALAPRLRLAISLQPMIRSKELYLAQSVQPESTGWRPAGRQSRVFTPVGATWGPN
jgi:hypothetical protein